MDKLDFLAEEYMLDSEAYRLFLDNFFEAFHPSKVMENALTHLLQLKENYEKAIAELFLNGYTLSEVHKFIQNEQPETK